jgi:malate dehydrogenase (oxaloacetate-decarboxylating)(NADP+)
MNIPVFHDDQHGTAIIAGAAFFNALEMIGQEGPRGEVRVLRRRARPRSCAKLFFELGVKPENLILCDTQGVVYTGRAHGHEPLQGAFAVDTPHRTLADALVGADVFVGRQRQGGRHPRHGQDDGQAPSSWRWPTPTRDHAPEAKGPARRDHVHGPQRLPQPGEQRPRLPVHLPRRPRRAGDLRERGHEDRGRARPRRAREARRGSAGRGEEGLPGDESFEFGPEYIIPKPFDPRVLLYVAPAVAKAAMDTGVARNPMDLRTYEARLQQKLSEIASL